MDGCVYISISGSEIVFKTPFSEEHDLLQFFRGITSIEDNSPIDFRAAGLQRKGHIDIWDMDIPLVFTTDESPPMTINNVFIGSNHGHPYGVLVVSQNHGKDSDIGSLWHDEQGTEWTILKIFSCDVILFMSENIGESKAKYAFKTLLTVA